LVLNEPKDTDTYICFVMFLPSLNETSNPYFLYTFNANKRTSIKSTLSSIIH